MFYKSFLLSDWQKKKKKKGNHFTRDTQPRPLASPAENWWSPTRDRLSLTNNNNPTLTHYVGRPSEAKL